MKLELKHLAGYLPYGLKGIHLGNSVEMTIHIFTEDIKENSISILGFFNECKPILRPLSDLTKEIEINGEKFVPLEYISTSVKDSQQNARYLFKGFYDNLSHWKTQRLLELHFDIYGLIENSLAISIHDVARS